MTDYEIDTTGNVHAFSREKDDLHNVWLCVDIIHPNQWKTTVLQFMRNGYRSTKEFARRYDDGKMEDVYNYYVCLQLSQMVSPSQNSVASHIERKDDITGITKEDKTIVMSFEDFMSYESVEHFKNEYRSARDLGLL